MAPSVRPDLMAPPVLEAFRVWKEKKAIMVILKFLDHRTSQLENVNLFLNWTKGDAGTLGQRGMKGDIGEPGYPGTSGRDVLLVFIFENA